MTLPSFLVSAGKGAAPYLTFGLSSAPLVWVTLALSVLLYLALRRNALERRVDSAPPWLVLGLLGVLAASCSAGYLSHYLRGGPRIVDATSYFLEARALAAGKVWFAVPEPVASFHGRFLLASPEGLAVLFPPGYPLVLSLGFLLGAPLAVGPTLALLLVFATHAVARAFGADRATSYAAAALSVTSAALRYHTADTMSHGLSALLVATAVAAAVRRSPRSALLAGAAAGLLVATRPVTGAIVFALVLFATRNPRPRLAAAVLGALPFVTFLGWHQHALTGEWLRSGQAAYYAVADGPPGCFRYGFGAGIGCWFEHGDFVKARMPNGYGFVAAVGNTLRRLAVHSSDIANAAPLALLVPYGALLLRREFAVRLGAATIALVVIGYAPFYFEGSYPGGGARFFADLLPLEHALIAIAARALGRLSLVVPVSLLGFSLHTSHQHDALARREGGRPMFEPDVLTEHGIKAGLVFVGTDHGFSLGHVPGLTDAHSGIVVSRARGDALDHALWEHLGKPAAYTYHYDPGSPRAKASVTPFVPGPSQRIEGESLYPPAAVAFGFANPEVRVTPCSSRNRVLRFRTTGSEPVRVSLRLPVGAPVSAGGPTSGGAPEGAAVRDGTPASRGPLVIGWVDDAHEMHVGVRLAGQPVRVAWTRVGDSPCRRGVVDRPLDLGAGGLELSAGGGALDYLEFPGRAP